MRAQYTSTYFPSKMKTKQNERERSSSQERQRKRTRRSSERSSAYKYTRVKEEYKNMKRTKGEYDETKRRERDYYGFKTDDGSLARDYSLNHKSWRDVNRGSNSNSRRQDSVSMERVKRNSQSPSENNTSAKERGSSLDKDTSKDTSFTQNSSLNHRSRSEKHSNPRRISRNREAVYKEISEMLSIEKHHTISTSGHFTSGDVRWCPRYINPDIKGHARGGTSLLHHRCRRCRKLCFHLLGRPGTTRLCLVCSGYKERYIPDWYYHRRCKYCM